MAGSDSIQTWLIFAFAICSGVIFGYVNQPDHVHQAVRSIVLDDDSLYADLADANVEIQPTHGLEYSYQDVRSQWLTQKRLTTLAVVFTYREVNALALKNFEFFLRTAVVPPHVAAAAGYVVEYFIIINGGAVSAHIPRYANVHVILRDNICWDFGAWAAAVSDVLRCQPDPSAHPATTEIPITLRPDGSAPRAECAMHTPSGTRRVDAVVLLNGSVRGPFIPLWVHLASVWQRLGLPLRTTVVSADGTVAHETIDIPPPRAARAASGARMSADRVNALASTPLAWLDLFLAPLSTRTRLVGTSLSCGTCLRPKAPHFPNATVACGYPHISSMSWAVDAVGLDAVLRHSSSLSCRAAVGGPDDDSTPLRMDPVGTDSTGRPLFDILQPLGRVSLLPLMSKRDYIHAFERGSSNAVMSEGFRIAAHLSAYIAGGDYFPSEATYGCNGRDNPFLEARYFGSTQMPHEVVFLKANRGANEAVLDEMSERAIAELAALEAGDAYRYREAPGDGDGAKSALPFVMMAPGVKLSALLTEFRKTSAAAWGKASGDPSVNASQADNSADCGRVPDACASVLQSPVVCRVGGKAADSDPIRGTYPRRGMAWAMVELCRDLGRRTLGTNA